MELISVNEARARNQEALARQAENKLTRHQAQGSCAGRQCTIANQLVWIREQHERSAAAWRAEDTGKEVKQ